MIWVFFFDKKLDKNKFGLNLILSLDQKKLVYKIF